MDIAGLKDIKFSHLSAMLIPKSPWDNTSPGFPKPDSRDRLHAVVRPARIGCTSGAFCYGSFGYGRYLCTERLDRTSGASTTTNAISGSVGAFAIQDPNNPVVEPKYDSRK